jgi:hypothetical protein
MNTDKRDMNEFKEVWETSRVCFRPLPIPLQPFPQILCGAIQSGIFVIGDQCFQVDQVELG